MESSSFWNPESTVLESGIQYPESGIHSMESRIQDCPGFPYMGAISPCYNVKKDFYNFKMKRSGNVKKNTILFLGQRNVKNCISIPFLK